MAVQDPEAADPRDAGAGLGAGAALLAAPELPLQAAPPPAAARLRPVHHHRQLHLRGDGERIIKHQSFISQYQ